MNALVDAALPHWGLTGAPYKLIAARENAVYRVEAPQGPRALRLHRQGYRSDAELRSELLWMQAAADGGTAVPAPIPMPNGDVLLRLQDTQIDMLTWLDGDTLETALQDASPQRRAALFHTLGAEMARLHDTSDSWTIPDDFTRPAWDLPGLLGDAPLWDRFWENPQLTTDERTLLQSFRARATQDLEPLQQTLDYGLIHADLIPGNALVEGNAIKLIDFDDGGFGFRLFEVATALIKHLDAPDITTLRTAVIRGYTSERPLDTHALDLILAIRAVTYVGWNITRMAEPNGKARNTRFIETACRLAERYIA